MLLPHDLPPIKKRPQDNKTNFSRSNFPFHLPSALNADRPLERRGLARDGVRLFVLDRYTEM